MSKKVWEGGRRERTRGEARRQRWTHSPDLPTPIPPSFCLSSRGMSLTQSHTPILYQFTDPPVYEVQSVPSLGARVWLSGLAVSPLSNDAGENGALLAQ